MLLRGQQQRLLSRSELRWRPKEKIEIGNAAEAKEKAEDEARVRVKANAVQREVVESVANIRDIEEAERGKR